MKAYFNEKLTEKNEIRISPDDLIVQRGYGIFDFFRIVDGKPLFIEDHLKRFISSAGSARIPLNVSFEVLKDRVLHLIDSNGKISGGIKLLLTGGKSPMGFQPVDPNLIIIQNEAKSPAAEQYQIGSKLITRSYMREHPEIKSTNYFQSVWLYEDIRQADAIDVLYHNKGIVHELSRSNIFLVSNGIIYTPEAGVLKGITRRKVMGLAGEDLQCREKTVLLSDIMQADEVFITSTLKKVMPVINIDGKPIADGKPGKYTKILMARFEDLTRDYINRAGS